MGALSSIGTSAVSVWQSMRDGICGIGPLTTIALEDLKGKWEAFGWHVMEINGNDIEAIIDACAMAKAVTEKPVCILAYTVPGKGVDFMEYDFHWHGVPPNHEQAREALHELRTLGGKIKGEHE